MGEASVERAMFWHKDHGVECVRREPLEAVAEAVASAVIGTDIGIVGIGAGIGIGVGVGVGVVWQHSRGIMTVLPHTPYPTRHVGPLGYAGRWVNYPAYSTA